MDVEQLRRILDLVRQHDVAEFELEHEGLRLRIRKHPGGAAAAAPAEIPAHPAGPPARPIATIDNAASAAAASGPEPVDVGGVELAIVRSPIVGTFYRSPEPDAASFVEVGSKVKKGQVLCIIEAMKLMNEIDSEFDGEVVNVYVENGLPVQYGERLFAIRRS
jgi:acetyl-CoA carboxylase biotin carboxyl carrier protein